jgi:predicted NBD/HSP70 family sugar kinase
MKKLKLIVPKFVPPLDPDYRPAVLANRNFLAEVAACSNRQSLVLGIERNNGEMSRFETQVFPENHPESEANLEYAERLVKFLLWQRGGWRVYVGGSPRIGEHIRNVYSKTGSRHFDFDFMGETVHEKKFEVMICSPHDVPREKENPKALGRHLDGCRIGFDLGASDRKVSAVVNGEPVFSEEVIWEPRKHADPEYHYHEVMASIKSAMAKMPRVDAIGGSSAGVIVDNRPMVASLFRGVAHERFDEVKNLFIRIRDELKVPLEVINDGDVTALAGAMSLEDNAVLGVALGSSEAVGYVDSSGKITGWLNELAFAPVDYSATAPSDEWSGDIGLGALYHSQQCVFRLAPRAGIALPAHVTDAEKLKFVQKKLEDGDPGALQIWESMGYFMGYSIAHYADFYDLRHVLILGRCTSGKGGELILEGARKVLREEFPELATRVNIQLPDEKSRRVGQSIAAASLPEIPK